MADESQTTPHDEGGVPHTPAAEHGLPSLQDILLPRKESGPTPLSAQRVNAAAVLEAATAELPREEKNENGELVVGPEASATQTPAAPLHAPGDVQTLHTYKSDIEETVRGKNISLADIAVAQARRAEGAPMAPSADREALIARVKQYGIGGALLALALLGLWFAYSFTQKQQTPAQTAALPGSFLFVDEVRPLSYTSGESRTSFMQSLVGGRDGTGLALGLVSRLYPEHTAADQTQTLPLTSQEFLAALNAGVPDTLMRSLSPAFLLGVHVFDGKQAFLVFKTDSYEQVYAGMLQWELTIQYDLAPLFDRAPRQHIPEEGITTPSGGTAPQFIKTAFVDRIVENHEARAIQNDAGDILLLWTFIDRNTLVITTNEYTLREIISRLTSAPTLVVPGTQ